MLTGHRLSSSSVGMVLFLPNPTKDELFPFLFRPVSPGRMQILKSAPWQHLDSTGTRVNGTNQHCHVLCNQLYTFYCTTPPKDRRSYLRVLLGGEDPTFRLNEVAMVVLGHLKVSPKWSDQLVKTLAADQDFSEEEIDLLLDRGLP